MYIINRFKVFGDISELRIRVNLFQECLFQPVSVLFIFLVRPGQNSFVLILDLFKRQKRLTIPPRFLFYANCIAP